MINKYKILALLVILLQNLHSQKSDSSRIKILGESVMNTKNSSNDQTKSMLELTRIYITTSDTSIESYAEAMIIKITNFSSQYFFHDYELKLPELLNKGKSSLYKKTRLYLIMANMQGAEINFEYYSKALYAIDKNKNSFSELKKAKCDSTLFLTNIHIQKLINSKQVRTCNNYYLSVILSCDKEKKKLDQIKRNYFLIK